MIDYENYLIPEISKRCKKLRRSKKYAMDTISDKKTISDIENGRVPASGNFISYSTLLAYEETEPFHVTKEQIVFRNSAETAKGIEWIFNGMFRLIMYKNLETHQIPIQKAVLKLAHTFAEFSRIRYHFLNSDEKTMVVFNKQLDHAYLLNGGMNPINIARKAYSKINRKTVIDYFEMEKRMWLICRNRIIGSFKSCVCEVNDDFKFNKINNRVDEWIASQFIKVIVPEIENKLKSNAVFKLGYIVKYLLKEVISNDLADSFQKTFPLSTKEKPHQRIIVNNRNPHFENLTEEDKKKRELDVRKILEEGIIPEDLDQSVTVQEFTGSNTLEEKGISDFLDELGEKKVPSDYIEENIPGVLSNNSEVVVQLQKRLNDAVMESVEEIIEIQNNFLDLITDEELERFMK